MILLQRFRVYLRQILDPSDEQEREEDTVEAIRKGIVFRGTNLWVLIFATFIASLGLNTNSTAVIIGAMLISPLMGPIMGIGLGVTAGFGLASGNLSYFFGAFYLFTINSVFIAVATTLGVRLMHFSKKKFMDKEREKKVHRIVYSIIFLTMVPSVYITYNMVKTNIFETNASRFIKNEFNFPNTLVVDRYVKTENPERRIEVSLIGKEISEEVIVSLKEKMLHYGLHDVPLVIHQGFGKEDIEMQNDVSNMLLQDYYMQNKQRIASQEKEISVLRERLNSYLLYDTIGHQVTPEVKILYPSVKSLAISRVIRNQVDSLRADTLYVAIVAFEQRLTEKEEYQFSAWLAARIGVKELKLIKE